MGQQVNFYLYRVKKAINTTWRPANYEDGTRVDGYIIHPCSIIKPIFKLSYPQGQETQYYTYNFAYVPIFKRWYWVKDVVFQDGLMEFHLEVDVLASYRADIAERNFYIVRTSNGSSPELVDRLYPATPLPTRSSVFSDKSFWEAGSSTSGWYVLGIVGSEGTSQYYAMNVSQFVNFGKAVFSGIDWMGDKADFQDISEDIIKSVVNPAQYITSVIRLPFYIDAVEGQLETEIPLGWWKVKAQAYRVVNYTKYISTSLKPADHPQLARGTYLNCFPYRRVKVYVPPFGCIEVNASKIRQDENVTIAVEVDVRTGACNVKILTASFNYMLANFQGNVGTSIAISDIQNNVLGALASGVMGVASVFAGNMIGAMEGLSGMIQEGIIQDVNTLSTQSSSVGVDDKAAIYTDCYEIAQEDNPDNGRPYMKNGSMHELGEGFYIVENGNIPIAGATEEETAKVKDFLERGMYYNL